ncbi:MAG TPA: lysophospholipid acyltransferase family protein [Longimicrobiales bacterium]|nr:lysophospholipid acyltransferase family protein [Longimicrobiales bacterium]
MVRHGIARWLGATASLFYDLECEGAYPDGPLVVAANHPNALLDPLIVFRSAGRLVRPLAKAPLFSHPLIGPSLRALGGLPVYRRQDDPALMGRNDRTFAAAVEALASGDAIQIFPEGQSHSGSELAPLRTGAARIALQAEAEHGWTLGVRVVPVGLTYARKPFFRGDALAVVGEPIPVADFREAHRDDPQAAARELTALLEARLRAVTVNVPATAQRRLVDTAERMWARERGVAGWRERSTLADRVPRLRAFAHGLVRLREEDPVRYAELSDRVARYRRLADALGAGETAEVPPETGAGDVVRFIAVRGLPLLAASLLAGLGAAAWAAPYLLPRLILRFASLREDEIATWKLVPSVLAYPAMYAVWLVLAWRAGGPIAALVAAIALPLLGAIAVAWRERIRDAAEDVRLFFRTAARPELVARLARERGSLVAEFDRLAERFGVAGPAPADEPGAGARD